MAEESMRNKILNGDIIRTAMTLGWPVMLSNVFQTVYNLTDAFWLGKLGSEAVAAPSISWPIMFLFISLSAGFGIAGISLVSQYTGARLAEKANKTAGQLLMFLLIGACMVSVVGFIFAGDVLTLMGASSAVLGTATPYLQIMFLAIPFLFLSFRIQIIAERLWRYKNPHDLDDFVSCFRHNFRSFLCVRLGFLT